MLGIREEYFDFLSKFFRLAVTKNFVGQLFCASQAFWYRINLWIREREGREEVFRFSIENFCLTVSENFVEKHSLCQNYSGIEKC